MTLEPILLGLLVAWSWLGVAAMLAFGLQQMLFGIAVVVVTAIAGLA